MRIRIPVSGKFDRSFPQSATATVDTKARLFTVRVYKKQKTYELPMDAVSQMVVERVVRFELKEKKRLKALEKKQKRALRS